MVKGETGEIERMLDHLERESSAIKMSEASFNKMLDTIMHVRGDDAKTLADAAVQVAGKIVAEMAEERKQRDFRGPEPKPAKTTKEKVDETKAMLETLKDLGTDSIDKMVLMSIVKEIWQG